MPSHSRTSLTSVDPRNGVAEAKRPLRVFTLVTTRSAAVRPRKTSFSSCTLTRKFFHPFGFSVEVPRGVPDVARPLGFFVRRFGAQGETVPAAMGQRDGWLRGRRDACTTRIELRKIDWSEM